MIINRSEQESLSQTINRISEGTEVVGTITTTGDIRIDGVLEGNLTSKGRIVIGETGRIKGELTCQYIDIWGTLEGSVNVSEITNLKAMSTITGDIKTVKLCIEVGAFFNGTCTMPTRATEEISKRSKAFKSA
jgi:cytoskeletal protein CcmA (bactofilin family)